MVAISGQLGIEIIERRKIVIIDPKATGVTQPYHYVEEMELHAAEKHLARCAGESRRLALEALRQTSAQLQNRGFALLGSAILLSSARPLPGLDKILGSHALIHTAEGEFFRLAFRQAFERLEIPVIGIRERELDDYAQKVFGKATAEVHKNIDSAGRSLGPPWTNDQKTAALAAAIVLKQN
ncbi:MAG: hypothetical protein LAO78_15365 [Acidobacteriia bacterium]|nr:hypothetical protein [Terriglobia bacterium]